MGHILKLEEIIMTELERLFLFAAKHHITKRQIGIVCYGKNWRNIYTAKAENAKIIKRNKKIEDAIRQIIETKNA